MFYHRKDRRQSRQKLDKLWRRTRLQQYNIFYDKIYILCKEFLAYEIFVPLHFISARGVLEQDRPRQDSQ